MSTPRPKSLAMLFLTGAFLMGGAVGYAAERAVSKPERARDETVDPVTALTRELGLRPDQRTVFDSVWAWRRAQSRAIMAPVRPALDSVRDSARVLMTTVLDRSQQEAFRRLIDRQQRAADAAARAREARR